MSKLYLVATPIGNLGDFSTRAAEVLKQVARIACEDTRTSSRLMGHYGIDTPLFPFHQHNEHRKINDLISMLDRGEDIALITDAGMPGLSDPGFLAARAAWQSGHTVCTIPGADACSTALACSGLPSDRYLFEGFLPHKKGRQTRLREIAEHEVTTVLFESPKRLNRLLGELIEHTGEARLVCIARELTKLHEEVQRGSLGELAAHWKERGEPKGEIVLIIAAKSYTE
ncbi:MAG: 16S rRNA (cytidine(1402)-2'-O)-methyltransferase [Balneolaceae bacterium]